MRGGPGPAWQIQVDAPPEAVYDYVADAGRHGEWGSRADAMTPGGPEA